MFSLISILTRLYGAVFGLVQRLTSGWALGLSARFVFASVLFMYFWNSALTKLGPGVLGFIEPSAGAYAQILPTLMEQVSYNTSEIAFFPYGLMVVLGTLAEFILPILIVVGLFTRGAAVAFIGFIVVMSVVDVTGHGAGAQTIGAMFDGNPSSMIADQRLMWIFILWVLVLRGPGVVSLDYVLGRWWRGRSSY